MTTTSKELAVPPPTVDGEIVESAFTKAEATAFSKKVKSASEQYVLKRDQLQTLIEQASQGNIHVALGCSWTAWFKDTVQIRPQDEADRKLWVESMSVKGISQRAIGDVLGVSAATVNRDLKDNAEAGVARETPEKSHGVDGKDYTRPEPKQPEPKQEPLDTTAVDLDDDDDDDEPQHRGQAEALREVDASLADWAKQLTTAFIGAAKFDDDVRPEAVPKHIKDIRASMTEINKALQVASAIWKATKPATAKAPAPKAVKKAPVKKAPVKRRPRTQRRPIIPGSDARLHTTITPGAAK